MSTQHSEGDIIFVGFIAAIYKDRNFMPAIVLEKDIPYSGTETDTYTYIKLYNTTWNKVITWSTSNILAGIRKGYVLTEEDYNREHMEKKEREGHHECA